MPTRADPQPWRGRILNVYTLEAWRRRSVARCLVEQVMRSAETRRIHTLSLGAVELSRSLYQQLGFELSPAEMLRRSEN